MLPLMQRGKHAPCLPVRSPSLHFPTNLTSTRCRRSARRTMRTPQSAPAPASVRLLVISGPSSPELSVLSALPPGVQVVKIGQTPADFSDLSEQQWESINVLLNCGVGANAGKKQDIQALWPRLPNLKWMHSSSAGLEHLLFPELVEGPVILTNAKGVYSNSLAEFALMACKWFAMDMPRVMRAKRDKRWDPFDVEELRGKTMGVVGLGDIGTSCARLGKAFQMSVVGLRRRTHITAEEAEVVEHIYPPEQIVELMSACDYVVVATPYTPATHGLVSAQAIQAMKPNGVLVNVGRGKCVDQEELTRALTAGRIRGAALDVFETEPLQESSPLWALDNVLLTPHCADRTKDFQFETLRLFVKNMGRYLAQEELLNVCDKRSGY